MKPNVIEAWAREEYTAGVSAGAAARQLIRSLGCADCAPTLKRLLEDLLAEANKASFDRSIILSRFMNVAPTEGQKALKESFDRINGRL